MNFHPGPQAYSLDDVRTRASSRLKFDPGDHDGDYSRNPEYYEYVVTNATKPAAVLIPFVERHGETHVILTKRTEKLKSHSGQVAFPGGRIDPGDTSPEIAALRESDEEIGLKNEHVQLIGRMPDYFTGSGYKIVPVLGIADSNVRLRANPDEVDYIFEVPLSFLMNPENHREGSRMFRGSRRYYLEMPFGEHYIWGVTAGIIRVIYDRLYG